MPGLYMPYEIYNGIFLLQRKWQKQRSSAQSQSTQSRIYAWDQLEWHFFHKAFRWFHYLLEWVKVLVVGKCRLPTQSLKSTCLASHHCIDYAFCSTKSPLSLGHAFIHPSLLPCFAVFFQPLIISSYWEMSWWSQISHRRVACSPWTFEE